MKNVNLLPFYRTKDQYIATTLYAFGMKLDTTEWDNGVCYFLFENFKKCEEIVKKYFSHELKISPITLFNAFKDIKSILYQ